MGNKSKIRGEKSKLIRKRRDKKGGKEKQWKEKGEKRKKNGKKNGKKSKRKPKN